MAYRIDTCTPKELQVRSENVVTDVKSSQTPLMDLSAVTVELEAGGIAKLQLLDRTVHDIAVFGPELISEDDPYAKPTAKGSLHLFFPQQLDNDTDGSLLAREFVLKLQMQDNCEVYLHEYNEDMDTWTSAPIIEHELDNELLGNSMVHCFIETKKADKSTFYMKSRNSVDTVKQGMKTAAGKWTVSYKSGSKVVTDTLRNYVDVEEAKIWYSGNDLNAIGTKPYVIFDKSKNYWLYSDANGNVEPVYADASAKSFYLPQHAAHAQWHA